MNTKKKDEEQFYHQSAYISRERIPVLAEAVWNFASVVLFSDHHYDKVQQDKIVGHIRCFFAYREGLFEAYQEFCKRIALHRALIMRINEGRMAIPAYDWFRHSYTEGLQRTGHLYAMYLQRPRCRPAARKCAALAEAILDITEEHSQANIDYWKKWFRHRRQTDMLCLFVEASTLINLKKPYHE